MTENIGQAIAAIYGEIGYVQKTGSISVGQRYNFAGEADLIGALRPHMVEHGVVMFVEYIGGVLHETYETSKGTVMNRVSLIATIKFLHAPSGTSISVSAAGEGSDVGDKATPKALTGAFKYALRQTFCIETGDDPDDTPSTEQERTQRPATPALHTAPANAPTLTQQAPSAPVQAQPEANEPRISPDGQMSYVEIDGYFYTPGECDHHPGEWNVSKNKKRYEDDDEYWVRCSEKSGPDLNHKGYCNGKARQMTDAEVADIQNGDALTDTAGPKMSWAAFRNTAEEKYGVVGVDIEAELGENLNKASVDRWMERTGLQIEDLLKAASDRKRGVEFSQQTLDA